MISQRSSGPVKEWSGVAGDAAGFSVAEVELIGK